jgi:prolyl-tRNA synthetase
MLTNYLIESHSGIFHLLPLGLRVQSKLERLLDKHMESIDASRLSLATITSEDLWKSSGRFDQLASEVMQYSRYGAF